MNGEVYLFSLYGLPSVYFIVYNLLSSSSVNSNLQNGQVEFFLVLQLYI